MAAAKGNDFWTKRSTHGKDKIFESPAAMWEAACEYFRYCINNPLIAQEIHGGKRMNVKKTHAFTIAEMCLYMGVNSKYFYNFEKQNDASGGWAEVIQQIKDTIHTQKLTAAYAGLINPALAMRDLGLKDSIESTNNNTNVNYNTVPVSKEEAREISQALENDY